MSVYEELRRRNIFRVGAAYLLVAWVVIQVTDVVGPALTLPAWTLTLVIWLFVIGFPLALFFAWVYELTPEGLKRESEVDRSESITRSTGRRIDRVVIGLLVVAVVSLVVDNYVLIEEHQPSVRQGVPDPAMGEAVAYNSIGVLPFVNMSNDPEQEYFSDGIAEELLNALAKLKGLQVAARTSSFAFKGMQQDITDIGRKLNVATVLEGSVRKAGNRLRITAQLIDVGNGYHLWSETYDRELTDVFVVQDEITAAIVDALKLHLDTGSESVRPAAPSVAAYDVYLQGKHRFSTGRREEIRAALDLFSTATDMDPQFAAAWSARALCVVLLRETDFAEGIPREESWLLARTAIDKALGLDPNQADAYVAEGMLHADEYRYEEALRSLDKAVEINPSLADAYMWRSRILGRFGRIREARSDVLQALELDPNNRVTANIAESLVDDFYDEDFLEAVRSHTTQFPDVQADLERDSLVAGAEFSAELYREYVETLGDDPLRIALVQMNWLKEYDIEALMQASRYPGEFLMWNYMEADRWDEAQAMFDALPPDRRQADLNLEEMSIMRASQGRCDEAIADLDRAHGGEIRVYSMLAPSATRSNSNLALNRAWCLRLLGRTDEADRVLELVRDLVDTLRDNTVYGIYLVVAKLQILDGDVPAALDTLEAARRRDEVHWTDRYDPILRTVNGNPRFIALFDEIDREIDAVRADLDMPPASL